MKERDLNIMDFVRETGEWPDLDIELRTDGEMSETERIVVKRLAAWRREALRFFRADAQPDTQPEEEPGA